MERELFLESNCLLFQWDQFVLDELYGTFSIDAFVTSHPIYVPVKTVDEMESVFDTISYSKVRKKSTQYEIGLDYVTRGYRIIAQHSIVLTDLNHVWFKFLYVH